MITESLQRIADQRGKLGISRRFLAARPQEYDYLGESEHDQARAIASRLIPAGDHPAESEQLRQQRTEIFDYIIDFLRSSTFEGNAGKLTGKGIGLSARPILVPTGMSPEALDVDAKPIIGSHEFREQYPWDTDFQNQLLLLIGANDLALGQLLNLIDVQRQYQRIPNALTTDFLSHPQPPLETDMVAKLLAAGVEDDGWLRPVMDGIRADLLTEWFDFDSGRINPRQYGPIIDQYQTVLSRYVSVHYHSLLVGCQDGKDHTLLNAEYGEDFLPVQLNCLLFDECHALASYYGAQAEFEWATFFEDLATAIKHDINALMWVEEGDWAGFRNYSIVDPAKEAASGGIRVTGHIHTDDLAAEIWPLYVGLASEAQARVILNNLKRYYWGNIGLATTNVAPRPGDVLNRELAKYWSLQWEKNAWPPLMMVAVEGLQKYSQAPGDDFDQMAVALQVQWVKALEAEFYHPTAGNRRCFHEKMPYDTSQPLAEGYYANLPGFGWTIASYAVFLNNLVKRGLGHMLLDSSV